VPGDIAGAGRMQKLDVRVRREGVSVYARRDLIVPGAGGVTRAVDLLAQPTDIADAPVALAAYSTRGDEPTTLKVILLVELLEAARGQIPAEYAFSILKDDRPVFETADALTLSADGGRAVVAAQLAPGRYRLRAAAVGPSGRGGSLEVPLSVGLRQADVFQFSDLIVGEAADPFAPATHVGAGSLAALLELYTTKPSEFEDVAVDLEVRLAGETEVVARAPARVRTSGVERRRMARGELDGAALATGSYVVSAIVRRANQPIGRVSRAVVIRGK
jgi:hypothetical protein